VIAYRMRGGFVQAVNAHAKRNRHTFSDLFHSACALLAYSAHLVQKIVLQLKVFTLENNSVDAMTPFRVMLL
jgi:mannose/cellobiose epimerase-like protein (N-acyl-D-glucosamine 2-epimerase family)